MAQNKEQTIGHAKMWWAGAKWIFMALIGLITCAGAFNWAASKPGEGFFWVVGGITAIYWIVYIVKNIKAAHQKVLNDVAAAKAAREAELKAKWPVNKRTKNEE